MADFFNLDSRRFFLTLTRITFGIWLAYVGFKKWLGGPAQFVGYITSEFDKTWSPHALNTALGWIILLAEPLCALWLLSGIKLRPAWTVTAGLLFLLTFGQTILGNHEVIANNWQFLVLAMVCAALSDQTRRET